MKIVSWNCNGAFRKKLQDVNSLDADLLLIQECENPELSTKDYRDWAGDYIWVGADKNKGIGIFPRNGHHASRLNWNGEYKLSGLRRAHHAHTWKTSSLKLFVPFLFDEKYTILGVWTKGSDAEIFGYVGQFWKYLQIHAEQLSAPNTLILGDFNSNAIWDKPDRWWNHSCVVSELADLYIDSLYHCKNNEEQGKESQPTFYLHRNLNKPYHIDYAFVTRELADLCDVEIGKDVDWLQLSDHMPITVTLKS